MIQIFQIIKLLKILFNEKNNKFLIKNNPEFISILDEKIKFEFGKSVFDNIILVNFLRLEKIKTEFILDYFKHNFELKELKLLFNELDDLNLPISQNDCLTIEKLP